MDKYLEVLLFLMIAIGIAMLAFQYNIVQTLKKTGTNASIFLFLPSDIRKFYKLINDEKDDKKKSQMKANYYGIIITTCSALIIIAIMILIISA